MVIINDYSILFFNINNKYICCFSGDSPLLKAISIGHLGIVDVILNAKRKYIVLGTFWIKRYRPRCKFHSYPINIHTERVSNFIDLSTCPISWPLTPTAAGSFNPVYYIHDYQFVVPSRANSRLESVTSQGSWLVQVYEVKLI